uniref:Uncharacterized protein n=2 Tax=Brassica oleracea TaxID=3712 RepID=A0A0D3D5C1_BRAOL|nr:unnamed protein product [Brassica oleracea]
MLGLNVFANVLNLVSLTTVIVMNVVKLNVVAPTLLMVQEDPLLHLSTNVFTPFVICIISVYTINLPINFIFFIFPDRTLYEMASVEVRGRKK